ncbi:hypothetical protein RN2511_036000 [Rhodococcus sp. NKCM2511]|nr:hypothetical protein RN2511_036000 [Rhodococcus sp. NKCM2511]
MAYEVVSSRRVHHDALVWQVPVLSLTGQSFLFTIALSPESTSTARTIAGALALIASVMSVQLIVRHRGFELADALWIDAFERAHGFTAQRSSVPQYQGPWFLKWLQNRVAYTTWIWGLLAFGAMAVVILVLTWTTDLLSH